MKLILNERPKLTKKHLNFAIAHKNAYGVSISDEEYDELLCNIAEDKFIDRYDRSQKCYEIYDNDVYIGDILFCHYDNEISISIFDEYANKGYAYRAIKLFLEKYYLDIHWFEAVIKEKNKNMEIVEKLLLKLGFEMQYTSSTGEHVWDFNR
ncbi:GNAT family N-acetyltransferase [Clostridium botulinum]|uniref:N-acetyltransferase domain-containing protein n=1 Tax=Clostridium botulinum (strain Langeland / NCTC 10281 / Type F) TaxID=441772 RepID=A7GB93_CLOBL|nr:GNAT family N-acetyltransferase [Clostridium botulinum]ABS42022.1 hypothetical protein CLI_0775 [Clostridium botulinum F str. Langeland]ADF98514.1 hypothetical protein CBF_0742 [Clostridium botulinum F str. 230613]KKM40195.1 hypothetical protein VT72_18040 [Clostridium botulinum]MBY6793518.1 GNAT family N-acetyltransferase [Clostridium botulinum]MBY6938916.1 GNAT family N-acetyltransferase [Clostridium botulinum]